MFTGFTDTDFDVFTIPGLEPRMERLIATVRPKLEELGRYFSTMLSAELGEEIFAHVAKHARRTVNPPNDTWVAFSNNARGYKQHPQFQIGLWETHLFVTFGYIYEAKDKALFSAKLKQHADEIIRSVPSDFMYIPDHMSPESKSAAEVGVEELVELADRLERIKRAELLIGKRFDRDVVTSWSGAQFLDQTQGVMERLIPLYKL